MILDGFVKDKNGLPIANADIEIKGEDFITLYKAVSDSRGYYSFDLPAGRYPFLIAVKDYVASNLEYWCQDIRIESDMSLDVSFDQLEIYGLHVFSVKGGKNGLMAYFRPMSLAKFKHGESDIAPDDISLRVMIDGKEASVIGVNKVIERADDREMTAYLIQVTGDTANTGYTRFDIEITDNDGCYGAATIFNAAV